MAAIVTDQFRILNASNFIDSVLDSNNSYYVFLGLSNPTNTGFGRTTTWDTNIPNPIDNLEYSSHYKDTALFGKKITSSNIRRVIRNVTWTSNTSYDMYRHDYSISNPAPNSNLSRLYDSNFYVINSDYRVYICIDNGSYGPSSENSKGNKSLDEPTFTDLEPSVAGESGDGYRWKYLFSVSPSDIIKFDSTEYIVVPNDWKTSTNSEIVSIRENGYSSSTNPNQIKQVYIANGGEGYESGIFDILGDGIGAKVSITVDTSKKITSTQVTAGGYGYTWAIVDLKRVGSIPNPAKLIPIIPPSKGHGYDIYTELGTDKILIYARFDDSTKDFPTDTKFSQVGIIKNPTIPSSDSVIFTENQYSTLSGIAFTSGFSGSPSIGQEITQTLSGQIGTARGYVASYDKETKVLKYFRDRSLYFENSLKIDQTDYNKVSSESKVLSFESSAENIVGSSPSFTSSIDTTFASNSNKITVGGKVIDLGVTFTGGLSNPEINTKSGEIIYIDNRPLVTRDIRQKEDIKIILEF